MKTRFIIVTIVMLINSLLYSQTTAGFYIEADYWSNVRLNDQDIYEKVAILKTENTIKVKLGAKVFDYKILSENQSSRYTHDYKVKLISSTIKNDSICIISLMVMPDQSMFIEIKDEWFVSGIRIKSITGGMAIFNFN
jgi:hypothetical protein